MGHWGICCYYHIDAYAFILKCCKSVGKIWLALLLSGVYILLLVAERKWGKRVEKDFHIERKSERPCKRLNAIVYAYIFALYFFLLFFFPHPYIPGTEAVTAFLKGYNLFAFSANAIWAALFYCEIYRATEKAAMKTGREIAVWSTICFLSAFLVFYVPFGYWWLPILLTGVYVWIARRRYILRPPPHGRGYAPSAHRLCAVYYREQERAGHQGISETSVSGPKVQRRHPRGHGMEPVGALGKGAAFPGYGAPRD